MPSTQQIIRILVIALIFVVPVVIRMVKAAQEAKERRRIEQMRQQAAHEAMRTGRSVEQVMVSQAPVNRPSQVNPQQIAQDRLREMAARRQAQIEALRRQRAQGGSVASTPPTSYQQRPRTGTGFQPGQAVGTQFQPQRSVQQQATDAAARRPPKRPARQAASAPVPKSFRTEDDFPPPTGEIGGGAHDHEGDVTHRLVPDSPEPVQGAGPRLARQARPTTGTRAVIGLADLRRAIVLREVLDPPVAMRDRPPAP